jgi:uncharacterized protein YjiK
MTRAPAARARFSLPALLLAAAVSSGLTAATLRYGAGLWNRLLALSTGETDRYSVVEEARPLPGIDQNISGLTYSHATNTLFAVINRPAKVVELDRQGNVLRILPVKSGLDLEGISHVSGDLFVLASEKGNMIWAARIPSTARSVSPLSPYSLGISLNRNRNKGVEGLSWDHNGQRLFVANEKSPLQIIEIRGLLSLLKGQPTPLKISVWNPDFSLRNLAGDISSVSFDERSGAMNVLSHESRRVFRFREDGRASVVLQLQQGHHGLRRRVRQPEGIAFDPAGNLYIVAEPNLFYRFVRTADRS